MRCDAETFERRGSRRGPLADTEHTCGQPSDHLGAHLCCSCDFTWADDEPTPKGPHD